MCRSNGLLTPGHMPYRCHQSQEIQLHCSRRDFIPGDLAHGRERIDTWGRAVQIICHRPDQSASLTNKWRGSHSRETT